MGKYFIVLSTWIMIASATVFGGSQLSVVQKAQLEVRNFHRMVDLARNKEQFNSMLFNHFDVAELRLAHLYPIDDQQFHLLKKRIDKNFLPPMRIDIFENEEVRTSFYEEKYAKIYLVRQIDVINFTFINELLEIYHPKDDPITKLEQLDRLREQEGAPFTTSAGFAFDPKVTLILDVGEAKPRLLDLIISLDPLYY